MTDKRIDPIRASENIRETYLRYLITTFGLKNKKLARQFQNLAKTSQGLFRGPVLEATPKYKKGKSLLDMITEKNSVLSQEFINYAPDLNADALENCLHLKRELYFHQENALRKTIGENRNIVVATGTGSGKTECFLLPIIDYLLKERAANRLGPGVRALLLYPMNALANDQVARLRKLLPAQTGITFGRYTGQTEQTYYQGIESFKQENGEIPQPNELFCRDQILGREPLARHWPHKGSPVITGPPHILLTNFAMLEYLLMRPQDSLLFDGEAGHTWRFLVLDEAHVYTGAMGSEIGYLMRRLKDRICQSQKGKLLCIATSATIGGKNKKTKQTIANSFKNLFGEPFEAGDVITGDIVPPKKILENFPEWGHGCSDFYNCLDDIMQEQYHSISALTESVQKKLAAGNSGEWPDKKTIARSVDSVRNLKNMEHAKDFLIFALMAGDKRMRSLIKTLENQPISIEKAVEILWGVSGAERDTEALKKNLIQLVHLGSRARLKQDSAPLLAARYHYFVRSLEGLSVCLLKSEQKDEQSQWPRLFIGRHREIPDAPGGKAIAFELQACSRCGHPFLHGYFQNVDEGHRFVSYVQRTRLEDMQESVWLSIDLKQAVESAEDEEPLRDEKPPVSGVTRPGPTQMGDEQYLCPRCGFISDNNTLSCPYCRRHDSKNSEEWFPVRQVYAKNGSVVKTCPACGGRRNFAGSIIRAFSPGDDAASSVLTDALMGDIPRVSEKPESEKAEKTENQKSGGRFARLATVKKTVSEASGKRRLLAFSDSRQDAAYFAAYLDRTANYILHRQLILKAVKKLLKQNPGIEAFDPNDLITPLIEEAQGVGLFGLKDTELTKKSEVSKWINAELIGVQRRYGLEGVGLITWELKHRDDLLQIVKEEEEGLIQDYQLNAEEFVLLLEIFLTELRRRNVLQNLINVLPKDTYFWPRNRPYSIRPNSVHSKLSIASWYPQAARNIRSDFLERLFERMELNPDKRSIHQILEDLWELSIQEEFGIWEEVSSVNRLWDGRGNDGAVRRVRYDAWIGHLSSGENLFKCDTCGNLSHISLKGVCPVYRCPGTLEPVDPDIEFAENHYRYLYEGKPVPISVLEHTAQITSQEGAERQRNFSDDEHSLNILSCSTTFELGVDVGQLLAVFLRNVPPTIANYVQRSGRAGRRLSAAAFVLTYCRSRPHDLGYFDDVNKLISGKVQPPKINIDNNRIARRHLHSAVLSHFWRMIHPERFDGPEGKWRGTVQWLFFGQESAAQIVYRWLQEEPRGLFDEISRIFPSEIRKSLGFDSWNWREKLVEKTEDDDGKSAWGGRLGLAQTELLSEYSEYENLQKKIPKLYSYVEAQKNRLQKRQILDFLASRNVLPKYGFPVDVVPLKLQSKDEWAQRVELDRDLKLALSEYAPGCTLVANGKIIKSYALERISGRAWPEYRFAICEQCGKLYRTETSHGELETVCECGQTLEPQGSFVEPVYGFKTQINADGQEPVEIRPQRTFSTRVYFSHYRVAPKEDEFIREGNPDELSGIQIQKRYSRYGVLSVFNFGRANQKFWLCSFCGYGDAGAERPKKHKTPWGMDCNGRLRKVCLGHEFQSDVLELRFRGASSAQYDQGFWLSLTAALLAGASKALDIERNDIDGTVLQFGGAGYRSLVLFDNVPGGAGHVRRVYENLQDVMEAAFGIADSCVGCSRDQSCHACLRNFYNQYAHDLLKRGPVADFLAKAISSTYRKNENGYFPLGIADSSRWIEQQIRRADEVRMIMDGIPEYHHEKSVGRDWYKIFYELAMKHALVHVFIRDDLYRIASSGTLQKISIHALTLLAEFPNVDIWVIPDAEECRSQLHLKTDTGEYAVRWPENTNPFAEAGHVELSVLTSFVECVKKDFDLLAEKHGDPSQTATQMAGLLQKTKVIRVKSGLRQSWKDLLSEHIPELIEHVEIYDRFLRNRYQFKSLEMLIHTIALKASHTGVKIKVTTCDEGSDNIREQFRKIQKKYEDKNVKIKYDLLDPSREIPHFRRVQIQGKENCSLWLDKGVDIFRFEDFDKPLFHTLETYIVAEYDQ
ncbi:DEAD/DEAH box helicase [Desulfonema magnum]|uniref:DEAD/DEAH box helicase, DUF1998 n=1 Tax=Desulfonema magnum TaxID=45655 RepID=A0A975BWP6_9BACT|nr:DEAD/DEAH box helicase [Desulfonema magnum]QTA92530.1 DEAD/DEAH box helicase, DUF1998 [Desulfonema magnum]